MSEAVDREQRLREADVLEESADRIEKSATELLGTNMTEIMCNAAKGFPEANLEERSYEVGQAMDARNREFAETLLAHVESTREEVARIREEVAAEAEAAENGAEGSDASGESQSTS